MLAVILTVLALAAVGVMVYATQRHRPSTTPSTISSALPFTDLKGSWAVAVDTAGNVYVADGGSDRVLQLAAGSSTPTVLPFTDLKSPQGVAVDTAGNVYVADWGNSRVLQLAAGSSTPTVLPFTDLKSPQGLAVDTAGNVYVADWGNSRVLQLAAGSSTPTVLPFSGLQFPSGVAVDTAGNVYVVDWLNDRVLNLAAGSSTPTVLPFSGLQFPSGVAVDTAGNVYVADGGSDRVLQLAAGSSTPTVLPFTDLKSPQGVAVDTAGNVYVADGGSDRVLHLVGSGSNQGTKTSTTRLTTTTTTAPPVAESALEGLLLSPDQVNAAMGATGMTVTRTHIAMSDDSATMEPRECLAVDGSAQVQVYAGSGYTAERDQTLQEGDNFTHYVEQAMVLFPSASQAGAFFTASAQQWPACRQYTHTQSNSLWAVGPISNANGTLSTTATQQNAKAPGWACGRALAVRNNVVIDVNTCSANPTDSAVNIANQIAAKVPTQ